MNFKITSSGNTFFKLSNLLGKRMPGLKFNKPPRPKVVGVLLGGGAHGLKHAGMLGGLSKHGYYPFDACQANSAGAISITYALGHRGGMRNLKKLFEKIEKKLVFKRAIFKKPLTALFDNSPLRELTKKNVNPNLVFSRLNKNNSNLIIQATEIENLGMSFKRAFFVTDGLFDKFKQKFKGSDTNVYKLTKDNIVNSVMASSAFPVAFPPEKIGNKFFNDGWVKSKNPIKDGLNLLSMIKKPSEEGYVFVLGCKNTDKITKNIDISKLEKENNAKVIILGKENLKLGLFDADKACKKAVDIIKKAYECTLLTLREVLKP